MGRLPGFDYKRPFFYMVTLKALPPQKRAAPGNGSGNNPDINGVHNYMSADLCADQTGTHLINGRGLMSIPRVMKAKLRLDKSVWSSLRIGFSSSIRYVFQFLFLLLGNRMLLRAGELGLIKGDLYVAVFDVVMNISYIFLGIYQAFADTMQPLASTFAAEHGKDDLKYLARLAMATGLMVGISAGTNVAAALKLARKLGKGKTVVTVLPDTAERYFSTPLFDE